MIPTLKSLKTSHKYEFNNQKKVACVVIQGIHGSTDAQRWDGEGQSRETSMKTNVGEIQADL